MWWTVAMAMQAAGPPDIRPMPRAVPAVPSGSCLDTDTNDVVVCARDPETFRMRPLPPQTERREGLPPASTTIGDVGISAEAEAGQALGPAPPRAMVRLKLPF